MLLVLECNFFLLLFIPVFQNFGKVIATMRKENGWTQETLARKTKMNSSYLGALERGQKNISLKNIERIAQVFDVPVSEMCRQAEEIKIQGKHK